MGVAVGSTHRGRGRGLSASLAAAALGMLVLALSHVSSAFAGSRGLHLTTPRLRGRRGVGLAALSWQQRLDKALLDVDAKPQARLRNLKSVLEDPGTVLQDVGRAVSAVANKGFREGHVEAIDTLWPKGTTARKDLEAIQALRKQVPEVIDEIRKNRPSTSQRAQVSPPSVSVPDLTSGLFQLLADPKKRKEAADEAKNALREKPRGLETPSYSVVRKDKEGMVQLRQYKPFTVARASMNTSASGGEYFSGEGFMTLAGYLFGKNSDATAMEMTSPVEISRGTDGAASMSFVLPEAYAVAPPRPEEEDGIEIATIPERLVLVKAFPGVVTAGEVERQRTALAEVLASTWTDLRQVNASEYSVLQYNAPYTLPWRRLNELAIVVEVVEPEAQPEAMTPASEEIGDASGGETGDASGEKTADAGSAIGAAKEVQATREEGTAASEEVEPAEASDAATEPGTAS